MTLTKFYKKDWVSELIKWVGLHTYQQSIFTNCLKCQTKPLHSDSRPPIKLGTVDTPWHIKNVIVKAKVPSWVSSVLNKFGDTTMGTLKADKWWTLGTIYLPIALISQWGESTPHVSAEEAAHFLQVVKHTMCRISAVIIVYKHFVSPSCSSGYLKQMLRYLSDLQTIHPSANFCPYHHLSLHLPYFFHLFGPSHCFLTYPFERLIGWI